MATRVTLWPSLLLPNTLFPLLSHPGKSERNPYGIVVTAGFSETLAVNVYIKGYLCIALIIWSVLMWEFLKTCKTFRIVMEDSQIFSLPSKEEKKHKSTYRTLILRWVCVCLRFTPQPVFLSMKNTFYLHWVTMDCIGVCAGVSWVPRHMWGDIRGYLVSIMDSWVQVQVNKVWWQAASPTERS